MAFPVHRMRRLRASEALRSLVRETRLAPTQFILPLFACPGRRRAARNQFHAGKLSALDRRAGEGVRGSGEAGDRRRDLVRDSGRQGRGGIRRLCRRRHRAASCASRQARGPEAAAHDRRLQLRVHQPWALRDGGGWRGAERSDAGMAGEGARFRTLARAPMSWRPAT